MDLEKFMQTYEDELTYRVFLPILGILAARHVTPQSHWRQRPP